MIGVLERNSINESGGRMPDPGFADWLERDFRLRPEQMSRLRESYPRSPIPGVKLGVMETGGTRH